MVALLIPALPISLHVSIVSSIAAVITACYVMVDNWWFEKTNYLVHTIVPIVIWIIWFVLPTKSPFQLLIIGLLTLVVLSSRSGIAISLYYNLKNQLTSSPTERREWREYKEKYFLRPDPIRTLSRSSRFTLTVLILIFISLGAWAFVSLPSCLVQGGLPEPGQATCGYRIPSGMNASDYRRLLTSERQSVLWLLGGLVAVLTLILTFRRDEVVRSDYRLSLKNHDLERDSNSTARYSAALEHLGRNEEIEQIGAVYALLRIAKDSPGDREAISNLLAAFIRSCDDGANKKTLPQKKVDVAFVSTGYGSPPPQHIKSFIIKSPDHRILVSAKTLSQVTGLGKGGPGMRPLYELDLEGINLNLADLSSGDFIGAKFKGASFQGGNLSEASFSSADLTSADFTASNLRDADLGGTLDQAKFHYARLGGANFTNGSLHGCSFLGADLRGADFSFTEGLTRQQIEEAKCWSAETRFPPGFHIAERRNLDCDDDT